MTCAKMIFAYHFLCFALQLKQLYLRMAIALQRWSGNCFSTMRKLSYLYVTWYVILLEDIKWKISERTVYSLCHILASYFLASLAHLPGVSLCLVHSLSFLYGQKGLFNKFKLIYLVCFLFWSTTFFSVIVEPKTVKERGRCILQRMVKGAMLRMWLMCW